MKQRLKILALSLLPAAVLVTSGQGQAIVENFNNYGDERVDLNTLGEAGGGWAGGWENSFRPDYRPGVNLSYDHPGYAYNNENLAGPTHGVATYASDSDGSQSGQRARRSFSEPLDGTVWISFLASVDGPTVREDPTQDGVNPDVIFWLNDGLSPANFVALRSQTDEEKERGYRVSAVVRYDGADTVLADTDFAEGTTHLFLTRLEINADGTNDNMSVWVNPDLTGGLGTPLLTLGGANAFGNSLSIIGASFTGPESYMDAIRISNAEDGFAQVIPEPSTYAMMFGGVLFAMTLIVRRFRRNR